MNSEVESFVRKNVPWVDLPEGIQQQLGNSQKEYHKCVVTFSIRNQVRYRGNLVRHVRKDEKKYYLDLVDYSRNNLMLFPYHLSDAIVREITVTPFQYYAEMLDTLIAQEKSYDSLPNFTAADCLRLMGVGRNQYIDLMNSSRTNKKFGFFRKSARDLLPSGPLESITILPWWVVQVGFVTEEDIKFNVDKAERCMIDQIIDNGSCPAGHLNYQHVKSLYLKGLLYFDVPMADDDVVTVPPLEGFVMNRVLGDYFETLLYKIFVSIDEHTTVKELANVLDVDVAHVRDAVSLYCRLGFAKKKNAELDSNDLHPSWYDQLGEDQMSNTRRSTTGSSDEDDSLLRELNRELASNGEETDAEDADGFVKPDKDEVISSYSNSLLVSNNHGHAKKIAFLFDSKLTAYLMMGNLSPGLKTHAVTMFEVGKLSDESMDSLVAELEKVSDVDGEGEAARYFSHALTLKQTIMFLRQNTRMKDDADETNNLCLGVDLLRCESLQSLDPSTASRLLVKNYSLLVSMAPLVTELRPIEIGRPPHLGPAIPEVSSIWFKMFLYHVTGNGPPSILLPKGCRIRRLPKVFDKFNRLLVTSWGNEPSKLPLNGALALLQDALLHSAILVQAHCDPEESQAKKATLPFPFAKATSGGDKWMKKPCLKKLGNVINVTHSCGYVTLVNLNYGFIPVRDDASNGALDPEGANLLEEELDQLESGELGEGKGDDDLSSGSDDATKRGLRLTLPRSKPENWVLLDVNFGVPLFDAELNEQICQGIIANNLWKTESLQNLEKSNRDLCVKLLDFIGEFQDVPIAQRLAKERVIKAASNESDLTLPTRELFFDGVQMHAAGANAVGWD